MVIEIERRRRRRGNGRPPGRQTAFAAAGRGAGCPTYTPRITLIIPILVEATESWQGQMATGAGRARWISG